MTPPEVDRSGPPEAGKARAFAFPRFERRRLANGLEVIIAPLSRLPLVDAQLVLPGGATHDPTASPGTASLTAAVLDEGTESLDSAQIAATVERLGGYLATGAGWETLQIGCGLLSRHLETGLRLIAEIARRPTFPDAEVERLRGQLLAEIERRAAQPSTVADDHLAAAIYGDSTYGRPRIGTRHSLGSLRRPHLTAFHAARALTGGSALVISGAIDAKSAFSRIEELFGDWQTPDFEPATRPQAPTPDGRTVTVVDREGVQTELRLGHAGPPRDHPDFTALSLLNSLLGGKFMSRVNLNLRERHGYTYGASSYFSWRRGPGPFVVSTAVDNRHAAAAATEILHEISRLRDELVTPEELSETRSYLVGVFPYGTQRLQGITTRLRNLAVYGLPDDYYDRYAERLAAVTRDELRECARRHLDPDRLAVVAVGPAAELRDDFAALGEVRVVGSP